METGKEFLIPLTKGHYGGPNDTAAALLGNSSIPGGYFWGEDVVIDDAGNLRARPQLAAVTTAATVGSYPVTVFKCGNYYYSALNSGRIQYWTGSAWTNTSSATTTFTGKVSVEYTSASGGASALAIVSTTGGATKLVAVNGTTGTELTPDNAKGYAGKDEDRIFCWNGGLMYYSNRGDYTAGYATGDDGQWFSLGESCTGVIGILNVAGSMYVVKQSSEANQIYVYKKVQTYSDDEELIDMTSFQQIFGVNDGVIGNEIDGLGVMGGNILAWVKGHGLGVFVEGGLDILSEPILAKSPSNVDCNCLVIPSGAGRYVICKREGDLASFVLDFVNRRWYKWNINPTCKGWGYPGGMFGVNLNQSPVRIGEFPTDTSDTTIVPIVYTPTMDFGAPLREKFLRKIFLNAKNVTQIDVYSRLTRTDSFASMKTLAYTPYSAGPPEVAEVPLEHVLKIEGDTRFDEIYLKITGKATVIIKNIGVEIDIGGRIYE